MAADVQSLFSRYILGYVHARRTQLVLSSTDFHYDYINKTLIPSLKAAPCVEAYPLLACPKHVDPFCFNLDPSVVVDLPPGTTLKLLKGNHRVHAEEVMALYEGPSFLWLVLVLHPDTLQLAPPLVKFLRRAHLTPPLCAWPRNPALLLKHVILLTQYLHMANQPELVSGVIDCLVIPEEVRPRKKTELLSDVFRRIVSSREIVDAVIHSDLLSEQLWMEGQEKTVFFLYYLRRFNLGSTAARVISASAKMSRALSCQLYRPFRIQDIIPPPALSAGVLHGDWEQLDKLRQIEDSFASISFDAVWAIVSSVSMEFGLPHMLLTPSSLGTNSSSNMPLNMYLHQTREVLKGGILLTLGFAPFATLSPSVKLQKTPSNEHHDIWHILMRYLHDAGCPDIPQKIRLIEGLLSPENATCMGEAWTSIVLGMDGEEAPTSVTNPDLDLDKNPLAKSVVRAWARAHAGAQPNASMLTTLPYQIL
ncbi:hypothetical protein NLJ89_g7568 [Agrocybe chaxingu]|uniref:Uncharacterized protein n=1 Tax=Agrocybe chaxingu TaxID=84603 RepID=A0A9W8JX38_9AGAR|nr:hypothetical protein NLJ89_g7568 [Agrocybe chaxingu]